MPTMNPAKLMQKLLEILNAWKDIAPTESFGGMTLAEFETEINKSLNVRAELVDLENQITNKTQERDTTDDENWEKAQFVVNSVAGNPKFGKNSGLYEAMGYISTAQRKSGLTRKKKNDTDDNDNE